MTEKRFLGFRCAHHEVKRPEYDPFRQPTNGMHQICGNPKRIRLAIVILVRRRESCFGAERESEDKTDHKKS
jgi:hypothetical protein